MGSCDISISSSQFSNDPYVVYDGIFTNRFGQMAVRSPNEHSSKKLVFGQHGKLVIEFLSVADAGNARIIIRGTAGSANLIKQAALSMTAAGVPCSSDAFELRSTVVLPTEGTWSGARKDSTSISHGRLRDAGSQSPHFTVNVISDTLCEIIVRKVNVVTHKGIVLRTALVIPVPYVTILEINKFKPGTVTSSVSSDSKEI